MFDKNLVFQFFFTSSENSRTLLTCLHGKLLLISIGYVYIRTCDNARVCMHAWQQVGCVTRLKQQMGYIYKSVGKEVLAEANEYYALKCYCRVFMFRKHLGGGTIGKTKTEYHVWWSESHSCRGVGRLAGLPRL